MVNNCALVKKEGFRISIIDTPGLFDTKLPGDEIRKSIIDCIQMTLPGPHLFLIVIQIGRFTREEIEALDNLFHIFGNSMEFHSVLVFTRYDDLQRDGIGIETYIEKGGEQLQTYVRKCNNRYIAVNNFVEGEKKIEMERDPIATLSKIANENQWQPYTHEMIEEAQKNVQPLLEVAKQEKDTLNKKEVEILECHYDNIQSNLSNKNEVLMAKIRSCTEERDRLLENKRLRIMKGKEISDTASTKDEIEQSELNDIE